MSLACFTTSRNSLSGSLSRWHIRPELDDAHAKFLGFLQQLQRLEGVARYGVREADGPRECVGAYAQLHPIYLSSSQSISRLQLSL